MQIANPVYDVVFKYLMDDNTIAKKFISLIIGEEIERLDFQPTEYSDDVDKGNRSLTVYRLDFAATVRLPDGGFKRIIIEIQKAKFSTDIMRFRNYLGKQYSNKNNIYDQDSRQKACPILSIYFLGHRLDNIHVPVTRVERKYYDNATGEELSAQEEFIESLTHDSFVIQIPELRRKRRNLLEKVLAVFEQPASVTTPHFLDISESDYPAEYREIIRRLIKAASEPQVRKTMDVEDEIIEELGSLERIIAVRDKTIDDQKKAINDKDKALDDQKRLIAELKRQLDNK
ncbi:Rpn family recombination-promoting nuclease/putative transposase [Candidatus Electrothrix laxa]